MMRAATWLTVAIALAAAGCEHGSTAAASVPVPKWRDDAAHVYRLKMSSRAAVTATPVPVGFELEGNLVVQTKSSGSSTTFLASIQHSRLRIDHNSGAAMPDDLSQQLAAPWGFEIVDGTAGSLRLRGGTKPVAAAIMSAVAAAFQYPSGPSDGAVWQHKETDGTGTFQARYARGSEPDTFTKAKLSYEKTLIPASGPLFGGMDWTPTVVASNGLLRVSSGELVSVRTHDELSVVLTPKSGVHSTTDFSIELDKGAKAAAADWQSLWTTTSAVAMGKMTLSDEPSRAHDTSRIAGVTFEKALAALEAERGAASAKAAKSPAGAAASDVDTARDELGSFSTMVALLRNDDKNVSAAVAAVRRGSVARTALLDALGSGGSAAAQSALADWMRDSTTSDDLRREAAFALIRTKHPNEGSVHALLDALADPLVREYSVYGLGTYARRLREDGRTELATEAVNRLIALLDTSTRSADRVDVLRGIANSGDARAFDKVRPLLEHRDESVRTAAVDALRLMPNPEVDSLLSEHLRTTETKGVRLAALDAAALRGPNDALANGVRTAATDAPDTQSRLRAVRLLGNWLTNRPEFRTVLERIAKSDAVETVRKAAAAALGA